MRREDNKNISTMLVRRSSEKTAIANPCRVFPFPIYISRLIRDCKSDIKPSNAARLGSLSIQINPYAYLFKKRTIGTRMV